MVAQRQSYSDHTELELWHVYFMTWRHRNKAYEFVIISRWEKQHSPKLVNSNKKYIIHKIQYMQYKKQLVDFFEWEEWELYLWATSCIKNQKQVYCDSGFPKIGGFERETAADKKSRLTVPIVKHTWNIQDPTIPKLWRSSVFQQRWAWWRHQSETSRSDNHDMQLGPYVWNWRRMKWIVSFIMYNSIYNEFPVNNTTKYALRL